MNLPTGSPEDMEGSIKNFRKINLSQVVNLEGFNFESICNGGKIELHGTSKNYMNMRGVPSKAKGRCFFQILSGGSQLRDFRSIHRGPSNKYLYRHNNKDYFVFKIGDKILGVEVRITQEKNEQAIVNKGKTPEQRSSVKRKVKKTLTLPNS